MSFLDLLIFIAIVNGFTLWLFHPHAIRMCWYFMRRRDVGLKEFLANMLCPSLDGLYPAAIREQFMRLSWHRYNLDVGPQDVILSCGSGEGHECFEWAKAGATVICVEPDAGQSQRLANLDFHAHALKLDGHDHTIDSLMTEYTITLTHVVADIEGDLIDVLHGARHTIQSCRPRMLFAVYHSEAESEACKAIVSDYCSGYRFKEIGINGWGGPILLECYTEESAG